MEILNKTLSEGDSAGYNGSWLKQTSAEHLSHASGHWDMFSKTMSEEEVRHHTTRLLMWWIRRERLTSNP